MHASFHFINQILQLAYITQACILNLRTYAMQASTWICTYQMQSIKVHELALPICVLLLSKNFDLSLFFNVAPSLSMSMSNLYFFDLSIFPKAYLSPLFNLNLKAFISLYNLSPFVINFHKRCASHWCKGSHWGRWLIIEMGIPIFHQVVVTIVVAENDTPIRL